MVKMWLQRVLVIIDHLSNNVKGVTKEITNKLNSFFGKRINENIIPKDKQITYSNLPDFLKKKTILVIQPKEKNLYGNKKILVLPNNDIGICKTRKFIYEYANNKKERYGVFDDDLILKRLVKV